MHWAKLVMDLICQMYLLYKAQFSLQSFCSPGTEGVYGGAFFLWWLNKSDRIGGGTCEVTNTADPISV